MANGKECVFSGRECDSMNCGKKETGFWVSLFRLDVPCIFAAQDLLKEAGKVSGAAVNQYSPDAKTRVVEVTANNKTTVFKISSGRKSVDGDLV